MVGDDQPGLLNVTPADLCRANEPEHAKSVDHGWWLEPVSLGPSLVLRCSLLLLLLPVTFDPGHQIPWFAKREVQHQLERRRPPGGVAVTTCA